MTYQLTRRPVIWNGLSLALVAVVVACASGNQGAVTLPAPFISITLERTPCFGTCPVYRVSIAGDGAVLFEGRNHVDSAHATSRLSADEVMALRRFFDDARFFELDDSYVSGEKNCTPYFTDAPTVITSIAIDGRSKGVRHDRGCGGVPERLSSLEDGIDRIVGVWRWTKGQPPQ